MFSHFPIIFLFLSVVSPSAVHHHKAVELFNTIEAAIVEQNRTKLAACFDNTFHIEASGVTINLHYWLYFLLNEPEHPKVLDIISFDTYFGMTLRIKEEKNRHVKYQTRLVSKEGDQVLISGRYYL